MTDGKSADLSDIEKSAVLLMSIGQDQAADVLRYLSAQEINRLSAAMARLSSISTVAVSGVFKEFTDLMLQQTSIGVGGEAYLRGALEKALGAEKAAESSSAFSTAANSPRSTPSSSPTRGSWSR